MLLNMTGHERDYLHALGIAVVLNTLYVRGAGAIFPCHRSSHRRRRFTGDLESVSDRPGA